MNGAVIAVCVIGIILDLLLAWALTRLGKLTDD